MKFDLARHCPLIRSSFDKLAAFNPRRVGLHGMVRGSGDATLPLIGGAGGRSVPLRVMDRRYDLMALGSAQRRRMAIALGDKTGERSSPLFKWCGTTTHNLQ